MIKFKQLLLFLLIIVHSKSLGMIFDNRYIPLLERPYSRRLEFNNNLSGEFFITIAENAFDEDNKTSVPEIFGKYDQIKVATAITKMGYANPLPIQYQGLNDIIWKRKGKIQTQGIDFYYNRAINKYISFGLSMLFIRADSWQWAYIKDNQFSNAEKDELSRVRRNMNETLGIKSEQSSESGIGDIDFYLRLGKIWEYAIKCKRIDLGAKLGFLIPTGKKRDINNTASIPFGGNGHFGLYLSANGEFELKEDWIAGFLIRFNKRFKKTGLQRIPIAEEILPYGALTTETTIDPGLAFIAMPYLAIEGLRDGLGFQAKYTYIYHAADSWSSLKDNKNIQGERITPTLYQVWKTSKWKSEYITLNAFYNFGRNQTEKNIMPRLYLNWDIPLKIFAAENSIKSHKMALGLEFNF